MIHITGQNALALLRQAVEIKGADYVDPASRPTAKGPYANACQYVTRDGSPSCIVGHALTLAGVSAHDFDNVNEGELGELVEELCFREVASFTDDAINILTAAQCAQDQGATWGEALQEAEEALS